MVITNTEALKIVGWSLLPLVLLFQVLKSVTFLMAQKKNYGIPTAGILNSF